MNFYSGGGSASQLMAVVASSILWLAPLSAFAVDATVTFTVNATVDQVDDNTGDGLCHTSANTCSLRAAIMQANHLSTNGRVIINVSPGTYQLTIAPSGANGDESGDLNLTSPVDPDQKIYINGANPISTIIDANHTDRAISISAGRKATISGLTVRNGNDSSVGGLGGGIQNTGNLTLSSCIIENNYSSSAGGGIGNRFEGVLAIQDCVVRLNATAYSGGGLYLAGLSSISYSRISSNVAVGAGGGVFVSENADAYFRATTISSNGANYGGGVEVYFTLVHPEQIPQITLVNSTLSGNFAYTHRAGRCAVADQQPVARLPLQHQHHRQ